jgi:2-polyprenyl-6-methoxyphenol hydroxylase-like FAD-dependent oxidoreductase
MLERKLSEQSSRPTSAIVVGGSLAGLMSALTLARVGIDVTVLERSDDRGRTGAVLSVPENLIQRLIGHARRSQTPMIGGLQAWFSVHAGLRSEAEADPRIVIRDATCVVRADQCDDAAWVVTRSGERIVADTVIGADGHRSVVRRAVAPHRPDARFAGYLIWLGVVQEASLVRNHRWPSSPDILTSGAYHLLGTGLPGQDFSVELGRRQLGWALYDRGWNELLYGKGCVRDGIVHHTLNAKDVPAEAFAHLNRVAKRWPPLWEDVIRDSVARRSVIATPVAEYLPERLAAGRIALVGDAAHVPTPMTGNGFKASLSDAEALSQSLARSLSNGSGIKDGLVAYERSRIDTVRNLVLDGQSFSRAYSAAAA